MATNGYQSKTLVGNWYEQRLDVAQPFKEYPEEKKVRENEAGSITCLNANGLPMNLGRIKRHNAWNTKAVIADDGYRDLDTVARSEIPDPSKNTSYNPARKTKLMINKDNIAELSSANRELTGPKTGFGSKIRTHEAGHGRSHFETTNHAFYNSGKNPKKESPNEVDQKYKEKWVESNGAGNRQDARVESIKKMTELTGETYKKSADPQDQTSIQRSWLPGEDPGITAVHKGLHKPADFQEDNECSLPLGRGEYATKTFNDQPAAYRKVRSDITRKMGTNNLSLR
eukprot:CAMPEP_0114988900 /NCGR_PEP_ID=MMETSP0216-20121206/9881_1 /TAXON_ID=223996 /ORGANISM="Protocruzia adherens, Strain Boccale" /LENGTH=284 /DNA_ID=CAMNT_0002351783 /DNA_START=35 /DNA_END=889 /DNA_ORIENTATION=+